jgi:hypothetical protein
MQAAIFVGPAAGQTGSVEFEDSRQQDSTNQAVGDIRFSADRMGQTMDGA